MDPLISSQTRLVAIEDLPAELREDGVMTDSGKIYDLAERRAAQLIPADILAAAGDAVVAQDQQRGNWPSPRLHDQPEPPWPAWNNNPIMVYLLTQAHARIEAGLALDVVLENLAVHAWFEGGIDNYDRARRDADPSE